MTAFTLRQYRPHQKAEFLRDYAVESRAAAKLLGDELKGLRFDFASVFQEHDRSKSVRIEFHGNERTVWVDVKGDDAVKVLVKSPTEFFSKPG
jgi:hypothetical protein